jgi:hypothetical protein
VRIHLSSIVAALDVDQPLVDEAEEGDVVGGLDELDTPWRAHVTVCYDQRPVGFGNRTEAGMQHERRGKGEAGYTRRLTNVPSGMSRVPRPGLVHQATISPSVLATTDSGSDGAHGQKSVGREIQLHIAKGKEK